MADFQKCGKSVDTENRRTINRWTQKIEGQYLYIGEHGKLKDNKLVNTENRKTVNRGTILWQVSVSNFNSETFLNDLYILGSIINIANKIMNSVGARFFEQFLPWGAKLKMPQKLLIVRLRLIAASRAKLTGWFWNSERPLSGQPNLLYCRFGRINPYYPASFIKEKYLISVRTLC